MSGDLQKRVTDIAAQVAEGNAIAKRTAEDVKMLRDKWADFADGKEGAHVRLDRLETKERWRDWAVRISGAAAIAAWIKGWS